MVTDVEHNNQAKMLWSEYIKTVAAATATCGEAVYAALSTCASAEMQARTRLDKALEQLATEVR